MLNCSLWEAAAPWDGSMVLKGCLGFAAGVGLDLGEERYLQVAAAVVGDGSRG